MNKILTSNKRVLGQSLLLIQALVFTGCSHRYDIKPFEVAPYPSKVMKSYSTTVVFSPRIKSDEYENPVLSQAFRKVFMDKLGSTFKDLKFAESERTAANYDLLILSTLRARTVNDYFTSGCLLNYTVEIKNKAGKFWLKPILNSSAVLAMVRIKRSVLRCLRSLRKR